MAGTTNFVAAQQVNRRNTVILLVALTALAAGIIAAVSTDRPAALME